jgi:Holliday junction resolvasome RuvABC endonuclease subunit
MRLDLDSLELSLERVRTLVTRPVDKKTRKVVRKNSDDLRRARQLHDGFHEELKDCVVAFGEIPTGTQGARAALGFGVALGVLASCKIPIIEVMPVETKLASAGHAKAEKPEVIAWAAARYPQMDWLRYQEDVIYRGQKRRSAGDLHEDNEHAADATAVVHAGIKTEQFKQLMALWKAAGVNVG